ncbi:GNAT family N-acetyltransferase [Phycicoccus sp. CSK15P-2]|uniref:GNAT family N-acetyltransferase n=1 Tax=Phycicoccus sp. CSK15P-2 TaxID=2807627 RepID=UPI0019523C2A|nr:GNAT family N-acetyltransferase [Phycicoccus sp. CSK15P-2]MBM6404766.1 GNAT family N-acetyltransferase [Phycicoccus sp. CSK15P-2]
MPTKPSAPTAPLVRAVEEHDHEAVHAILTSRSVIAGTMRLPYAALHTTKERLSPDPGVHRLVAEVDGTVAGFAELITSPGHPRAAHVGDLNMLCVHPDHEGRGVGRALLDAVLELADDWLSLTRLSLVVFADNPRAARLYERYGFEHEGVMRRLNRSRGTDVDGLMMARLRD